VGNTDSGETLFF